MDEVAAADMFASLSNPDRLKVIRALVQAGPEGLSAGDIAIKIDASPSRASFHLAGLTDAGVIDRERKSRSLIYRVNFERIAGLITFLMKDCCCGSPTLQRCCGS